MCLPSRASRCRTAFRISGTAASPFCQDTRGRPQRGTDTATRSAHMGSPDRPRRPCCDRATAQRWLQAGDDTKMRGKIPEGVVASTCNDRARLLLVRTGSGPARGGAPFVIPHLEASDVHLKRPPAQVQSGRFHQQLVLREDRVAGVARSPSLGVLQPVLMPSRGRRRFGVCAGCGCRELLGPSVRRRHPVRPRCRQAKRRPMARGHGPRGSPSPRRRLSSASRCS
jgi:hypothetical protein